MLRSTVLLLLALVLAAPAAAAQREPRIIGGGVAAPGKYPAQAFLRIDLGVATIQCGGTLVARRKVVTAAHCLDAANYAAPVSPFPSYIPPSQVVVFLGSNIAGQGERLDVASIAAHPDYRPQNANNDVAVLTLAADARQDALPLVDPAADPASFAPGALGTTVGWGLTDAEDDRSASAELREVGVPIRSDEDCNDANSYGGGVNAPLFICAGYASTDTARGDSCQGDSGGPLMVRSAGVLHLVGVVSNGEGCAVADKYGQYTELPAPGIRAFLLAQAGTPPTVSPVTPARATLGATVRLGSTGTDVASAAWDLDDDGAFDDAAGLDVDFTPTALGARPVRVRVLDPDGMAAVAERTITVVDAPASASDPRPSTPTVPSSPSAITGRFVALSARKAAGRLRVTGRVRGPGCADGRVRVTVLRGSRTLAKRVTKARGSTCAFTARLPRSLRGRVSVRIAFLGTTAVTPVSATKVRRV